MFRRKISPPSSVLKNKQRKKSARILLATYFQAGFLSGLFFYPDDGGDVFLRNIG
jgi:hypothetical protein